MIDQAVLESVQRFRAESPSLEDSEDERDQQPMHAVLETIQEQGNTIESLSALKKNCQKILNDYLVTISAEPASPVADAANQQLFYFKLKMVMHKVDDKIVALIDHIDAADNLTEITHLLFQFEQELPLLSPGKSGVASPVDALNARISQCKVMVEAVRVSSQLANQSSEKHIPRQ